ALYAAEARNHWWQHLRGTVSDARINQPTQANPYPLPKIDINDKPVSDAGNNFGRIARLGIQELTTFVQSALAEPVAGIEARHWITFFRAYTDAHDSEDVWRKLQALLDSKLHGQTSDAERASELLRELTALLSAR
ncbi:MAG: hypothetical protein ACRDGS_05900, partial [Chloroflexota bacterium]